MRRPVPFDLMRSRWDDRDAAYANRREPLSEQEIQAVRDMRAREIGDVVAIERPRAALYVETWTPPTVRRVW